MKINREKLYDLYMDQVNLICDECDWVSTFTPKDIVSIISSIIEENPDLVTEIFK